MCWQVDGDESVTSDVELSHRSNHSGVATISTLGIGLLCSISTTAALLIGQLLTHFSLLGTIEARPSSPSLRHTTEFMAPLNPFQVMSADEVLIETQEDEEDEETRTAEIPPGISRGWG